MAEIPGVLDRKTVDRFAREWDNKSPDEEFTIQARINPDTERDEIRIARGIALDPNNPYTDLILEEEIILYYEMDDDITPYEAPPSSE